MRKRYALQFSARWRQANNGMVFGRSIRGSAVARNVFQDGYLNVKALPKVLSRRLVDGLPTRSLSSSHNHQPHCTLRSPLFNSPVPQPGRQPPQDGEPDAAHTACPVVADRCELLQHVSNIHIPARPRESRASKLSSGGGRGLTGILLLPTPDLHGTPSTSSPPNCAPCPTRRPSIMAKQ